MKISQIIKFLAEVIRDSGDKDIYDLEVKDDSLLIYNIKEGVQIEVENNEYNTK